MRTTKLTVINLEDGDHIKVWLNGAELYLKAGTDPVVSMKRFRGLRVLPADFVGPREGIAKEIGELVFDQIDVVVIDQH